MCSTDLNLSLNGDTFCDMKDHYDDLLRRTLGNMEMHGNADAVITLKQTIHLERTKRSTPSGMKDFTIPTFKHDITAVMQAKDKVSGQLKGEFELVFDNDEKEYVMRKIDNGQQSLFQDDEPNGKFADKDYKPTTEYAEAEVPSDVGGALTEGLRGLPAPSEPDDAADECDGDSCPIPAEILEEKDESREEESDEDDGLHQDRHDEGTPFGWLSKFVGEKMRVTEAMGNYTVRTAEGNRVVLSSATDPANPFFCDKDKLSAHVQHDLLCVGYGKKELAVISILCSKCGDALFTLIAPGASEEEISDAMGPDKDAAPDESEADDDDYPYTPPEE